MGFAKFLTAKVIEENVPRQMTFYREIIKLSKGIAQRFSKSIPKGNNFVVGDYEAAIAAKEASIAASIAAKEKREKQLAEAESLSIRAVDTQLLAKANENMHVKLSLDDYKIKRSKIIKELFRNNPEFFYNELEKGAEDLQKSPVPEDSWVGFVISQLH